MQRLITPTLEEQVEIAWWVSLMQWIGSEILHLNEMNETIF
jgi:hypothetical protein